MFSCSLKHRVKQINGFVSWKPAIRKLFSFVLFLGSDVADFDGKSFLLYRFNPKSTTALKDVISLKFKTIHKDGVLLHREGQSGDHITLTLVNGKLSLLINIGTKGQLNCSCASFKIV